MEGPGVWEEGGRVWEWPLPLAMQGQAPCPEVARPSLTPPFRAGQGGKKDLSGDLEGAG